MSEPLLAHDKCSPKATAQLQIPSDQDRTGRWQAFFVPTALLCLSISGTVIFPLYISKSATTPRNNENSGDTTNFGCDPSGNTFSTYEPPNLFDTRYTFAINLGFGEFEFAAAKLIDVGWDLVVSRGGQALVALCIYRTFRRSMLNGSETSTMSYDKFLALSYAPDTFLALRTYGSDLLVGRLSASKRNVCRSVALIACTIYVLVFPTWTSAMTGYQADMVPYIASNISSYVQVEMNSLPSCDGVLFDQIQEGVLFDQNEAVDCIKPIVDWTRIVGVSNTTCEHRVPALPFRHTINIKRADVNVTEPFMYASNNVYQRFDGAGTGLTPNYTLIYTPPHSQLRQSGWAYFWHDQRVKTLDDVLERAVCQPGATYKWGFSTMLLLAFLVTTVCIMLTLYAVWLDGMFLRHDGKVEDVFGALRAAFLVVSSFHAEVGAEATILREKELRWQIKQASAHVRIRPMELIARPHGTVFWTEMKSANQDDIPLSKLQEIRSSRRREPVRLVYPEIREPLQG